MSIVKEDMLALADELVEHNTECSWRSAISRSYYAAYHCCLDWEASHGIPGSNAGSAGGKHQQLLNRLRNPPPEMKDGDLRKFSKMLAPSLESLRNFRVEADYDLDTCPDQERARNHVARARTVLDRVSAVAKGTIVATAA